MKSPKKIQILAILILLMILIIALTYGCQSSHSNSSSNSVTTGMVLDPDAEAYEPSTDLSTDDAGIAIPGYSNIYFPAGETQVQLTLYNPEQNTCLFRFELYLDDEEKAIASTGLIQPGQAVQTITLDRALNAGEYTLNIKVLPYTADTQTALNNALVRASLYVLAEE